MTSVYRWLRLSLAAGVALAGLASTAGAGAAPPPPVPVEAALAAHAAAGGSVLVIVGLRSAALASAVTPQAEAAAIATAQAGAAEAVTRTGGVIGYRYASIPYLSARVDAAGLAALRASPWVESVTEDVPERLSLAESTVVIGAAGVTGAWARGYTGAGQTLAIVDTGVDKSHPFLAGKVAAEACFSNAGGAGTLDNSQTVCPNNAPVMTSAGSAVPCNFAECDHGTHVAGIAAGKAYSGMAADTGGATFSGVAPDATLIAIQVFSLLAGGSIGTYPSDQIAGLDYLYTTLRSQYAIAAVNMSLGGSTHYSSYCDTISGNGGVSGRKAAIDRLRAAGIVTLVASGNEGNTSGLSSPACISSAVSVGSTEDGGLGTTLDKVSSFSNSASYLNLLAPGELIKSSVPTGLVYNHGGAKFANLQGTSMATPHVAGAWAVLKQGRPSASVDEILALLQNTGKSVTDTRNNVTTPRIQLDAAVAQLKPSLSPAAGVDFGNVTVDLPGLQSVTVQNPLPKPVTLTVASLTGAGLKLAGGTCTLGGTLAANSTCTVQLNATPAQAGAFSGSLSLAYTPTVTAEAGVLTAALSGTGVLLCPGNLVDNAVFERTSATWVQTDTVQGAALPFCPGGCAVGGAGPAGPASGRGWALFGAYTNTVTSTVSVTSTVNLTSTIQLTHTVEVTQTLGQPPVVVTDTVIVTTTQIITTPTTITNTVVLTNPVAVTQQLTQTLVVPTGTLSLQFLFNVSRADASPGVTPTFQALLDTTPVFTVTTEQLSSYSQYQLVRVALPPEPAPVTRTVTFSATTPANGPVVDFNLDSVGVCAPAYFPFYLPVISR